MLIMSDGILPGNPKSWQYRKIIYIKSIQLKDLRREKR